MKTYEMDYFLGTKRFVGFAAQPKVLKPNTPVVMIAHMCSGRVEFVDKKAMDMAQKGYIGSVIGVYGEGKIGQSINESTELMKAFVGDRKLLQDHLQAFTNPIANDKAMGAVYNKTADKRSTKLIAILLWSVLNDI